MKFSRILLAYFLVLVFAGAGSATELASDVIKDIEMGYVWSGGWTMGYSGADATAMLGVALTVTLASGETWSSCFNPTPCTTCAVLTGPRIQNTAGTSPSAQAPTAFSDPVWHGTTPAGDGYAVAVQGHTAMLQRQNALLALLSMAALKGLPVALSRPGWHPPYLPVTCFDTVRVCFSGECD